MFGLWCGVNSSQEGSGMNFEFIEVYDDNLTRKC